MHFFKLGRIVIILYNTAVLYTIYNVYRVYPIYRDGKNPKNPKYVAVVFGFYCGFWCFTEVFHNNIKNKKGLIKV